LADEEEMNQMNESRKEQAVAGRRKKKKSTIEGQLA
jgi:hypothetical protein